jgi:hypothetical protein
MAIAELLGIGQRAFIGSSSQFHSMLHASRAMKKERSPARGFIYFAGAHAPRADRR